MGVSVVGVLVVLVALGLAWKQWGGMLGRVLQYGKLALQPLFKTQWKSQVRAGKPIVLQPLAITEPFKVHPETLAQFYAVCKLPQEDALGQVPILFPEAIGITVCSELLARPEFPFPLMGAVHIKNYVCMRRPVSATETLRLTAKVREETRIAHRGTEVDVELSLTDDKNEVPWEALLTFLIMHKHPQGTTALRAPEEAPPSSVHTKQTVVWDLGGDTGRKYAAVSSDYNPIHLHALTAKLLGFKRAIAHGMYTTARAYGDCLRFMKDSTVFPLEGYAVYKRPVFLPGQVELKMSRVDQGVYFEMVNPADGKLLQSGSLTSCKQ